MTGLPISHRYPLVLILYGNVCLLNGNLDLRLLSPLLQREFLRKSRRKKEETALPGFYQSEQSPLLLILNDRNFFLLTIKDSQQLHAALIRLY